MARSLHLVAAAARAVVSDCGDRQNVECGEIQKLNYQLDVVIRGSSHLLGRLLGPGVTILMSVVGVGIGNRKILCFFFFFCG